MAARRKQLFIQEFVTQAVENASTAATATNQVFRCAKPFVIDRVDYINPTGLTNDAANYFVLTLQNGATVMAQWSTQTGAEGAIAANTWVQLTNSATAANLNGAIGDAIKFVMTKNGTQTLPAGRLVVHGRYL